MPCMTLQQSSLALARPHYVRGNQTIENYDGKYERHLYMQRVHELHVATNCTLLSLIKCAANLSPLQLLLLLLSSRNSVASITVLWHDMLG